MTRKKIEVNGQDWSITGHKIGLWHMHGTQFESVKASYLYADWIWCIQVKIFLFLRFLTQKTIFYFYYFLWGFIRDSVWLLIMVMHCGVNEGLTYQAAFDSLCWWCYSCCSFKTGMGDFSSSFSLLVSLIELSNKKRKRDTIWCRLAEKHSRSSVHIL